MFANLRNALLAVALTGLTAGTAGAAEPSYGVCRTAIHDYVQNTLNLTVKDIDMRTYAEPSDGFSMLFNNGDALVYVEECNGFLSFEVNQTWSVCEHIPHYNADGSAYVRYEGAYGGCAKG